jgi:hypothetical protein
MTRVLLPHAEADWHVQAGSLEWSCWETAAHVAHDLVAYAGQVAGGATASYLPFDLVVAPSPPRRVLEVVAACGRLLRGAVERAGPETVALGIGECPTREASLQWASRKRSCTLTTSRRVLAWTGDLRNP